MRRFGERVDLEREAGRALQDLEKGDRPEPGDMAALILEVVARRNPETIARLAAMRQGPPEEVGG
jgi:hypothetical protein